MSERELPWWRRPTFVGAALLALLAYLPALAAAPGRMPADSKLYLYLDPGRFLADAAGSFDPRQLAGWVPHQHIAYLWPSGPWFWLFEALGVPDWIAHRLWIGSLLFAAGAGTRWCLRTLGLSPVAALTGALVYQLSLYVLPYVSRTSVMLLPWAGLGWIVGLTVRATRRRGWGDPAAIALVVLTVGAVNATALAMIVPAPVLWLVHAAWARIVTWREAALTALRIGALCVPTSLWWAAMLVVQGRHGTPVLPYSESLADVSSTATSTEVWRSLGYWLFYVRDPYAATTTASLRYLSSTPAIVVSYLVPVVCLAGLVWARWAHRRFAMLLVATGVVLAVGVHPIDERSPLMRVLAGGEDSGLALALRSSTRALPLLLLGLAIGGGALVDSLGPARWPGALRPRRDHLLAAGIGALAVVNLPALWTGALVDPALERDEDPPAAWRAAAAALDDDDGAGRVLQLPGAEFGAFRWGYTVDQPLPGLVERGVVTRDLLPLGSTAAMDLLFALDDRFQSGVAEPASIAPVARLLGADTIWLTNDHAFDRFRTARPEVVRDVVHGAPGTGEPAGFGEPAVNRPQVATTDGRSLTDPRVGQPLPPVELVPVDGAVVRAATTEAVVSGSGEGLVDLAAAGVIDGREAIRYSAAIDDLADAVTHAAAVLVTDSNRSRARHWRSSQDTLGYTESADPDLALLREVPADERLPIVESPARDSVTFAEQAGPVRATATAYGEPFAYLPEHRPFMAIDGDPTTAWLVGEHGEPVGETLRLLGDLGGSPTAVTLRQPTAPGHRRIVEIEVTERATAPDGDATVTTRVALDDRSVTPDGQAIELRPDTRVVDITVTAVGGGDPGTAGAVAGVGFSEIGHGLGATTEVVVVPDDASSRAPANVPLAYSLTRWRTDPLDRWRSDPEPGLVRSIAVPDDRAFAVSIDVRIDARATDAELAELFGWPVVASTRLTGSLRSVGAAALDGDPGSAWVTPFDHVVDASLTITGVDAPVDRVAILQRRGDASLVTAIALSVGEDERLVRLDPDEDGMAIAAVDPPLPPGELTIRVAEIVAATTVDRRFGDTVVLPAAIAEIDVPGAPTTDLATGPVLECVPVADVAGRVVRATLDLTGWYGASLGAAALPATVCDPELALGAGRHVVTGVRHALPLTLDRLVLDDGARDALDGADPASATVVDRTRFGRTVEVTGCPDGCWLTVGEGWNPAWQAAADGRSLGDPVLLDGGFNGWRIGPGGATVEVRWTAQRPVDVGLAVSGLAALGAVVLVVRDRRRRASPPTAPAQPPRWTWSPAAPERPAWFVVGVWAACTGSVAGPGWALAGAAVGIVAARRPRVPIAELTAVSTVGVLGLAVAYLERRDAPFPGGGWPSVADSLHPIGMFAAGAILAGAILASDAEVAPDTDAAAVPVDDT